MKFLVPCCIIIILVILAGCGSNPNGINNKVVILGFDGVDPGLTENWMEEGKLPNLKKLKQIGSYKRLKTSNPAESPVSWSNFAVGANPGVHGIYDFIARDTQSYMPYLAEINKSDPLFMFDLVPVGSYEFSNNQKGKPFWKVASENGLKTSLLQIPVLFPVEELPLCHSMAGLGVPDIKWSQATFNYFTSFKTDIKDEKYIFGGKIGLLETNDNHIFTGEISGPWDPLISEKIRTLEIEISDLETKWDNHPEEENKILPKLDKLDEKIAKLDEKVEMTMPLTFTRNSDLLTRELEFEFSGNKGKLPLQDWSDWYPIEFKVTSFMKIKGICKFYVLEIHPHIKVYMSPIDFDPRDPLIPVTCPKEYSAEIQENLGYFKLRGWTAETQGLKENLIDEKAFMDDCYATMARREKILEYTMDNYPANITIIVFGITDRVQHMMWRFIDKTHSAYDSELDKEFGESILKIYQQMDNYVGKYLNKIDEDTLFMVLSDHGFSSFRRGMNLNTWLVENRYMKFQDQDLSQNSDEFYSQESLFPNVDWTETQAYALGLGQIYINLMGREKFGIVPPEQYDFVCDKIKTELEAYVDPETGEKPALTVFKKGEIFHGPNVEHSEDNTGAPDLQVGFAPGYRSSFATCMGSIPKEIIEENETKWSGDHASVHPSIVPGIFFCNKNIQNETPDIIDIAPTVLDYFNLPHPEYMEGKNLFKEVDNN